MHRAGVERFLLRTYIGFLVVPCKGLHKVPCQGSMLFLLRAGMAQGPKVRNVSYWKSPGHIQEQVIFVHRASPTYPQHQETKPLKGTMQQTPQNTYKKSKGTVFVANHPNGSKERLDELREASDASTCNMKLLVSLINSMVRPGGVYFRTSTLMYLRIVINIQI